jgi:hypothetical protein
MKNKNLTAIARGLFVLLLILNAFVVIHSLVPAANAQVFPDSLCADEPENKGFTLHYEIGGMWFMSCICDPYIKDCCGCI